MKACTVAARQRGLKASREDDGPTSMWLTCQARQSLSRCRTSRMPGKGWAVLFSWRPGKKRLGPGLAPQKPVRQVQPHQWDKLIDTQLVGAGRTETRA